MQEVSTVKQKEEQCQDEKFIYEENIGIFLILLIF